MILLSMILLKASTSSRRSRAARRRIATPCLPFHHQCSASSPSWPTFHLSPSCFFSIFFCNHESARIKCPSKQSGRALARQSVSGGKLKSPASALAEAFISPAPFAKRIPASLPSVPSGKSVVRFPPTLREKSSQ